jgi:hypothetical protein
MPNCFTSGLSNALQFGMMTACEYRWMRLCSRGAHASRRRVEMDRVRFDALARLLATPGSRRAALGALLGAGLAGLSTDTLAAKSKRARKRRGGSKKRNNRNKVKASSNGNGNLGNSVCAKWCQDTFDGKEAGQCTAAAAKGEGPCYECGPAAGPDNGLVLCDGACLEGECCSNQQCKNPTPVCDSDNTCVACTANNQCGQGGVCTCGGNDESGQCQGDFFQGFEQDTAGWTGVNRVASQTDDIPAPTGGFYAQVPGPASGTAGFTRWGGYSSVFPSGGYTTELAIYLDPADTPADAQFDYSSAINQPNCNHRRDFIFTAGKSSNNPDFCVSASNNSPGWPCNPDRDPETITSAGWYLFRHEFRDDGSGVLEVEMTLLDPSNAVVGAWTLSDPTDIIGTTVGGNRYGWFSSNDFAFVAIDDSSRQS